MGASCSGLSLSIDAVTLDEIKAASVGLRRWQLLQEGKSREEVDAIISGSDVAGNKDGKGASTLLQRLGGASALRWVFNIVYKKAMEDPSLAHIFTGVDMNPQHGLPHKQAEFMCFLLSGEKNLSLPYRGKGIHEYLREVHTRLRDQCNPPLTPKHWEVMISIIKDAMEEAGVAEDVASETLGIIARCKQWFFTPAPGEATTQADDMVPPTNVTSLATVPPTSAAGTRPPTTPSMIGSPGANGGLDQNPAVQSNASAAVTTAAAAPPEPYAAPPAVPVAPQLLPPPPLAAPAGVLPAPQLLPPPPPPFQLKFWQVGDPISRGNSFNSAKESSTGGPGSRRSSSSNAPQPSPATGGVAGGAVAAMASTSPSSGAIRPASFIVIGSGPSGASPAAAAAAGAAAAALRAPGSRQGSIIQPPSFISAGSPGYLSGARYDAPISPPSFLRDDPSVAAAATAAAATTAAAAGPVSPIRATSQSHDGGGLNVRPASAVSSNGGTRRPVSLDLAAVASSPLGIPAIGGAGSGSTKVRPAIPVIPAGRSTVLTAGKTLVQSPSQQRR